jgi:signal transduction histidine kinase
MCQLLTSSRCTRALIIRRGKYGMSVRADFARAMEGQEDSAAVQDCGAGWIGLPAALRSGMTDTSRSLDARDGACAGFVSARRHAAHDGVGEVEFSSQLEAAKLASLAEFAAGAGHEINNPLATISGRVQMLLREETDPERRQALMTIGGQALRIRDMIGDLMLIGRPPEPRLEQVDLRDAVSAAVDPLRELAARNDCNIRLDAVDPVEVQADPVQLKVVVASLVRNAIEAQRNGGEILVAVTADFLDAGRRLDDGYRFRAD